MRAGDLELHDLFDVELQLLRDRDAARDDLRRRDRRIGRSIAATDDPADRRRTLRDWIHELHREAGAQGDATAGQRIVRAYQALGWILTLLGLSSGGGAAAAVLAYDGRHPVNAVHFLAVFVALQLFLVALFLSSSLVWRLRERAPLLGGIYGLLRLGAHALVGLLERRLSAEQRALLQAARGRLRSSQVLYGDLERWLLVAVAQRFGLWFNLGALATCLYLITFSDLAFAWQTTLDWSAEGFHRALAVLAAPWSWIYPDGLPSLDVVRASRYFRVAGGGFDAARAALLGEWWRFLVLCLLGYGLLPRVVITVLARARLRRALAALRLDHADIAALLERLTSPLVETHAPDPEAAPPPTAAAPGAPTATPRATVAAVLVWGDVPVDDARVATLVQRRFGWGVAALARAGVDEARRDDDAIRALTADGDPRAPLVLLAESFEAPTREARGFVSRLRAAAGADRPIVVALVDSDDDTGFIAPAPDDLRVWQKHLAGLGDPYLRVEALVEGPS